MVRAILQGSVELEPPSVQHFLWQSESDAMPATSTFLNQVDTSWVHELTSGRLMQLRLEEDTWNNTLYIPVLATGISATIILLQAALRLLFKGDEVSSKTAGDETIFPPDISGRLARYIKSLGGPVVCSFKVARLLGCLALFAFSLVTLIIEKEGRCNFPGIAVAVTSWYTSLLAAASLVPNSWSKHFTRHNICVLLTLVGVYGYRDIWPLATYTDVPMDAAEGWLLWAKIVISTITAILIPLFIPTEYVPIDPKNPMQVPNPEQTASLFSFLVYEFLTPIIMEASRVSHLSHTQLPALADYDYSSHLTEKAFPHLDPFRGAKRHLGIGLIQVYSWEFSAMAISIVIQVLAGFLSPLALNRILVTLETGGDDNYIRPWLWVACLFLGPFIVSICFQAYVFYGTQTLARTRAVLTELVFEHSLRIRFKAETSGDGEKESASAIATPRPESIVSESGEGSSNGDSNETQSVQTATESSTAKGKAKDTSQANAPTAAPAPEAKKKDNLVGKINTLVTVDVDNIINAKDFLMIFLQVPLELILALAFLYIVLGWSAFVGFASIVALLPVPGYLAAKIQTIQKTKLDMTDARVETVTETVGVLRMIKLFGWEKRMSQIVAEKRDEELRWLWNEKMIGLLNDIINFAIPTVTMVITYAAYTTIMGKSLNASKIFSSMVVFDIIRNLLHRSSYMFTQTLKGKVSLDRIGNFLRETELLDDFEEEKTQSIVPPSQHDENLIGFKNATFAWSKEEENGTQTPSARSFRLRIEGDLLFKRGCINLIVGPTGSGKTSVLMALLGEMHFIPSAVDSWYNLPRGGGIAYAAQQSWVQNETIRDNILFGSPYDEQRYNKVIQQCALKRDLELFEAGDQTEVGEKGLTLSGGQKARVTLARAIYSSAEIILLDDILAALDVHTSKSIVEDCLKGDLIRGRTVLLVTHNVALTSPVADNIITVGLDGYARAVGNDISIALAVDPTLAHEVELEEDKDEVEKETIDAETKEVKKSDGKLIMAEEIEEGRVSWQSMQLFFNSLGGNHPILFLGIWALGFLCMHCGDMFGVWFLGYWGSQYEGHHPEDVAVSYYLSMYSFILFASVSVYAAVMVLYNYGAMRASRKINGMLVDSVLGSTLRWLDETPASRIITRCTQDISSVDGDLQAFFGAVVELATCMVVRLAGPVIMTPIILGPGILIAVIGIYIGNIYLKAQISVKRETSNARAPVLAHFGAAIAGLTSIRAYGAQTSFKAESLKRIDHYTKVARTSFNLNRWVSVRIDLLGASFTAGLASYLLLNRTLSAANIGFSLKMSLDFCSFILWLVRCYNEFEVQANSLERIQAYINIEHEPKATEAGKPPASWPSSGDLRVEGLSARYSATGPKSSLTLSLLRCIPTEGTVYYDGLATDQINLDELRSKITIIPQMPELLSGTLRRNLDPFDQNDDATLNNALRASGLFTLQSETDEARLTLDSEIASGGGNLSVGQRQIIALARAIVRNSKLLILDEDHKTDSIIQSSLRNELSSDVTVLTVAHRLQTIMDADKIMVLDSGRIVEFDSPQTLLKMKGGYFKSLVDGSGDKQTLYAMMDAKASGSA
ncbi:ATP-binding cassette transporter abc4 [Psilocybe cubensis]|uniref:ATP-binding cassette transporter abc4 n=1 Tax=Psilocybe cubensis TaxID=181762 RepID=A0ACB8H0S4_PSICU|nr:ATP-binding cassette transporter abc4 [Psilocybe cubensis]KAH9480844.1 ATP-binding cassette transporter abc4 [Psilocybe cubensis]